MSEISSFLAHLAAIEISTEIVEEISDEVFIPWEVYRAIYHLSRSSLENSAIHLSLRDRFLELRRQLELEYALLLVDPNSQFYNRRAVSEVKSSLNALAAKSQRDWENIPTKLPSPSSIERTNRLLRDRRFLQTLYKLNQAKLDLERRDRSLHQDFPATEISDRIYARTLIQLDGEIANRYDRAILRCSEREKLLQIHQRSVTAAQKQWRELLKFIVGFGRNNR